MIGPELNKRQQQYQHTLKKIRDAMETMIEKKGFQKTTIRDICQEAGITVGTFYHYFSSKDALMMDRYVDVANTYMKYYEEVLQYDEPVEALKKYVICHKEYADTWKLSTIAAYYQYLVVEFQEWTAQYPYATFNVPKALFDRAQEQGLITTAYTSDELTEMMMCILAGINVRQAQARRMELRSVVYQQALDWVESLRT